MSTFSMSEDHRWLVAGERQWPVAYAFVTDNHIPLDGITDDWWVAIRSARIMVESGWELSVIWGHMTYSDNHDARRYEDETDSCFGVRVEFTETPHTVEVGLFRHDSDDLVGEPAGYVTVEEFNALVDAISQVPSDAEFDNDEWTALMGREMCDG